MQILLQDQNWTVMAAAEWCSSVLLRVTSMLSYGTSCSLRYSVVAVVGTMTRHLANYAHFHLPRHFHYLTLTSPRPHSYHQGVIFPRTEITRSIFDPRPVRRVKTLHRSIRSGSSGRLLYYGGRGIAELATSCWSFLHNLLLLGVAVLVEVAMVVAV